MQEISLARMKRIFRNRIYRRLMRLPIKALIAIDEWRGLRKKTPSYRISMKRERQKEALNSFSARWHLNHKDAGVRFAGLLGVPTLSPEVCPKVADVLNKLRESKAPKIVKPLSGFGSRNVFIVYTPEDIFDLSRHREVGGINDLESRLLSCEQKGWLLESFLASTNDDRCPAHDLKFYSFYGEVGLVLEVRRQPEVRFSWWGSDGTYLGKAKYNQPVFRGHGFSREEACLAKKLSQEIPVPFIRVDFLKSSRGTYFGEFTPEPGGFDHFPYEMDAYLGKLYLEAEARLLKDIWDGKQFDVFRKVIEKR